MRFHCGISFSLKTIKKFLLPFILGILAFLGFNFIYDKESIPLGFIKVNALENYNSYYDFNYTDLSSYENYVIDNNNVKFKDFVNSVKSRTDIVNEYLISFQIGTNSISNIYLYVFPSNMTFYFNIYGENKNLLFKNTINTNFGGFYSISLGSINDIYNESNYLNFISCITSNTCNSDSGFNTTRRLSTGSTIITDNDSFTFESNYVVPYYSTHDLIINNIYSTSSSIYFYKSLRVNNENVEVSTKFPTYTDYIESQNQPTPDEPIPDEPIPDEPTPDEPITNHKALFNKIYWFDDNTTEIGILSSIYILLFLYCITMILFKFLTYVKTVRWKK